MDRTAGNDFKFNLETEFVPILGLIEEQLNSKGEESKDKEPRKATSIQDNHHPALLSLLASELSVSPEYIHDFELYVLSSPKARCGSLNSIFRHLYDVQPATLGGLNSEFIFSPRMDNQFSS